MAERQVTFETTKGAVVVKLDETAAPDVLGNFLELAEKGFYNGLTFAVYDGMGPAITGGQHDISEHAAATLIFLYSDHTSLQFYIRLAVASDLESLRTNYVVLGNVVSSSEIVNTLDKKDRLLTVSGEP